MNTDQRISYLNRLTDIPTTDMAWFAGWLCADGSIINAGGGRPRISFKLTDRDPLDKFSEMFGNVVNGPYAPTGLGRKPTFSWRISGTKAALIVEEVQHLFSDRYAERAALVSDYRESPKGRKLNSDDVARIKQELAAGGHGTGRRLAKEYGVGDSMVSAIKRGAAWRDV